MNITQNMIRGQILCGVKDLDTMKNRIVAAALREELNKMPLSLVKHMPTTINYLEKRISIGHITRLFHTYHVVMECPELSISENAIWYKYDNTARKTDAYGDPEDILSILKAAISWLKENKKEVELTVSKVYAETLHAIEIENKLMGLEQSVFKQLAESLLPENTPITIENGGKEDSIVFIGQYEARYQRIQQRIHLSSFYDVRINRKKFIEEQTVGPTGEWTVKLVELYNRWVKDKK